MKKIALLVLTLILSTACRGGAGPNFQPRASPPVPLGGNLSNTSQTAYVTKLGNPPTSSPALSGLVYQQITITASTYTVDAGSNFDYLIFTDSTNNTITITLPAPTAGRFLQFKDKTGQAGTNNVTIQQHASETIDGATSVVIAQAYGYLSLYSDGTNWSVSERFAACPAGNSPIGTWVNITPPYVIIHPTFTGVLIPLVNPQNPSEIYVTTDSDGVFRSEDCGNTWVQANTGVNAASLNSGRIWSAVIDPINPQTIYALTGYGDGGVWKTTNSGTDWAQTFPPGSDIAAQAGGFVHVIRMDPTNHLHILVNFHGDCSPPYTPVCFGESMDGGITWNVLDYPTSIATDWCEACSIDFLHSSVWLSAEGIGGIFLTTDSSSTWSNVTPSGTQNWNVALPVFKLPSGTFYVGSQVGVLSGTNNGETWTLLPNTYSYINPVMGDGVTLYGASYTNTTLFLTAASYNTPTVWNTIAAPGLPTSPAVGPVAFANDFAHHRLYLTLQTSGLWQTTTR